jgi:membrane-associated phospholipid phosphatase
MAQPPHASHDVLPGTGRSLSIARILSQGFNPFVNGIASYLIVALMTPPSGLTWAALALGIQLVPSMTLYTVRLRQGVYSDPDVSVREERNEMYLVGTASVLVTVLVLVLASAPAPVLALTVGILVLGITCGVINLFWKISMHAVAIAMLATVGVLYSATLGAVLWLCALAVGWARVRTRNHTTLQVIAGLAVAAAIISVSFAVFDSV